MKISELAELFDKTVVPFGGGGTVYTTCCHPPEFMIVNGYTYEVVVVRIAEQTTLPLGIFERNQKLTVTGMPKDVPQRRSAVLYPSIDCFGPKKETPVSGEVTVMRVVFENPCWNGVSDATSAF